MTNYRLRDFDFEFDVRDLLENEEPGVRPGSASQAPKASFVVLDRFAGINIKSSTSLPTRHDRILRRIAHLIATSRRLNMLISNIELVGYGDVAGSDPVSRDLGSKRAHFVKEKLQKLMTDIAPGTATGVNFMISPPAAGSTLKDCVDLRLPITCQVFWAEYDLQSLPPDKVRTAQKDMLGIYANPNINQSERHHDVTIIGLELERRVKARAEHVLMGNFIPPQPMYSTAAETYDAVKRLSEMQLKLFRKWHPGTSYGIDQASLMRCFHTFSNGQLRSPNTAFPTDAVGEPDTSHFFMFAEFGFLAADSGFEPQAWTVALRAMVSSQEVFMHVYRKNPPEKPPSLMGASVARPPATVTHPLGDFVAANFVPTDTTTTTRGRGQSDSERLIAVTAKYSGMGLNALRDAHAVNLLRAQTLAP